MRLFEILMLLAILPVLVWPLLPWRRPRVVSFLPGTAVILLIIQLLVEGYRWQMLPAYVLVVVLFLVTLPRLRKPVTTEKKWSGWAIAGSVVGLLIWLVALALPYALPVPRLPEVMEPYFIGTQTFHLIDDSRDEIYTEDPADKREIMMQIWYPTDPDAKGETAVYLEDLDVMAAVIAERLNLPPFLLDHINLTKLHARKDVEVLAVEDGFPVLVFSHGLQGMRQQNTAMVEELVSQGFVVATIDHTYGNVMTVFPDGRVAFYNPDVLSGEGDPPRTNTQLVQVWADDIGFVLDELAAWNEADGGGFNGRLDLSKVGVFGHSTGGGATVTFCGQDARCGAGVGLDAWVVPVSDEIVAAGLAQPFLFLRADKWNFEDNSENHAIAEKLHAEASETSYLATVDGANHYDFTDIPLLSPLTPQLNLSSDMDSAYTVGMMNAMTSAFFRQELQEADELVLGAMVYPEMRVVGNGK
jgi:predicted dienelactone hydrolase